MNTQYIRIRSRVFVGLDVELAIVANKDAIVRTSVNESKAFSIMTFFLEAQR